MGSRMVRCCAFSSMALVLLGWPFITSSAEPPAGRWVRAYSIDFQVVAMKKEIAITAKTASKLFTKAFPHLQENWKKEIPAKVENTKNGGTIPKGVDRIWIKPTETKPYAMTYQFSKKEIVVLVLQHKGTYLWHQYYECLARFRLPRNKNTDAIFKIRLPHQNLWANSGSGKAPRR
jgi:hypothetical protein